MVGVNGRTKLLDSWFGNKKEGGKDWGPTIPLTVMPTMTQRPPSRPHLSEVPLLPSSAKLGTSSLTHGPLGNTHDSNHSREGNMS